MNLSEGDLRRDDVLEPVPVKVREELARETKSKSWVDLV